MKYLKNLDEFNESFFGKVKDFFGAKKNSDIEEEDKSNLISGEKTFAVTKGSIDRLMQYDSPEAVFELINPIVALKK